MSSTGRTYLEEVIALLTAVRDEQWSALEQAAELVAGAVVTGGLVHVFGTGHSHLLAEELFYRAGGLAQVNPILVDALMLHAGAARGTRLEPLSGLGEAILDDEPIGPNDVLVVISNSGGNAACVEMARAAIARGIPTIALTSLQHATAAAARSGSGPRLHDIADVVLDNRGRPGDACADLEGLDVAVGPTSTAVGAAILNAVVVEAVRLVLERGGSPDVFASSNVTGGDDVNADLIARYSSRVRSL
ncbi:MAG: SIS domain-containing protein [Sporichthyaceae bacterium]